jgi:hypothetical protein
MFLGDSMVCYEVLLNGKRLCVAGVSQGVLVGALTWASRPAAADRPWHLDLRVGGLSDEHDHVDWALQELKIGDEVQFSVVECELPDPPIDVRPVQPAEAAARSLASARDYYRELNRRKAELEAEWGTRLIE